MPTSLQGIANKARRDPTHRFQDLSRLLIPDFLRSCWPELRKNAASGVDRVTAKQYFRDFDANIKNLVERLKQGRYRAKLVLRKWIPKGKDKLRPLGLPALEDKLLQTAVTRILNAIWEADFLPCSYGYRPNRGARQAATELQETLNHGRYRCVVEADIKGFFDNIDHDWLVRMLELRINDGRFVRLLRKWLRAGVLETDGQVHYPEAGTPQGGIVSPVLANIYLHYALDLWFDKVVRKHCQGQVTLVRYADDFVCLFENRSEADWFYNQLPERLGKFGLKLSVEKTQIVGFSRFPENDGNSFVFLGFEYRWGKSRKGKMRVKMRTARRKQQQSLERLGEWCRQHRHLRLREFLGVLNAKLLGYYNYFGVIGNYRSLVQYFRAATRIVFKWLNRRSQRRSFNWVEFRSMLKRHGIKNPRITEKWRSRPRASLTPC